MPVKTFTFNGSHPLVDRQTPVKTLPYDGKCVGGYIPRGNLVPPYKLVKFSRKLHEIDVVCPEHFFSKVPAAKILHETSSRMAVADLRGGHSWHPPQTKIFSISCSFSENLVKIICWHPPAGGLVPPPMEILDPPLDVYHPPTHPLVVITGLGRWWWWLGLLFFHKQ